MLSQLGYQIASKSNIPQLLKNINPTGGTHFRDSLIGGCGLLLQLSEVLEKTNTSEMWNFVHVVLTDGEDNGSKNSLAETLGIMKAIGNKVRVKSLKTIIIGVGVSSQTEKELKAIAHVGGENA